MSVTREAQEIVERLVHKGVMRCKYGNLTLTEAVCEEVVAPVAELIEAAQAMLPKLDQIEKDTAGIFVLNAIHGGSYKGANWSEEYKALTAALTALRGAA